MVIDAENVGLCDLLFISVSCLNVNFIPFVMKTCQLTMMDKCLLTVLCSGYLGSPFPP